MACWQGARQAAIQIREMTKKIDRLRPGTVNCLADVFRLLGEPNRLRILCAIGNDCKSVTELTSETGIGQSNTSFHLRFLRNASLVQAEPRGRNIYYRVHDKELLGFLADLAHWVNRALPDKVKTEAEIRSRSLRQKRTNSS